MTTDELIRRIKEQADDGVEKTECPWCVEIQHIIFEYEADQKELREKMEQDAEALVPHYKSKDSDLWCY